MLENVRKCQKCNTEKSDKLINRDISNTRFINRIIFDKNLVEIHMINEPINLNNLIYVGFFVLELSKELMYDFHYRFMKAKYGNDTEIIIYSYGLLIL